MQPRTVPPRPGTPIFLNTEKSSADVGFPKPGSSF